MERTQVVEPEAVTGRFTRAESEERELPEAPPLRRLIGPSVILIGVGIASGEYILYPYIASQAGPSAVAMATADKREAAPGVCYLR